MNRTFADNPEPCAEVADCDAPLKSSSSNANPKSIDELIDDLGCETDSQPVYRSNGYLDDKVSADQEEPHDVLLSPGVIFPGTNDGIGDDD